MGIGNRPVAWLVLGLLTLGLVGVIALQAVPPPVTPSAAPQAAAPVAASPTAAPAAAAPSGGGASTKIAATEKDFAIALDKSSAAPGSVTFNVTNQGPSPHNISIKELNKTSDTIDAGKTGKFTVDLPAGTYTVICQIPGHEQLGMKTTLTVK